jgi:hypothetical protein
MNCDMGGEDFGRYGRELKIPSLLLRLGATPAAQLKASLAPGGKEVPILHSSEFAPDVALALPTGIRVLSTLVVSLLPPGGGAVQH